MGFHVGQKVVCISEHWHAIPEADIATPFRPRKNGIYHVRRAEYTDASRSSRHPLYKGGEVQILWLTEITNPADIPGGEYGFASFMFRAVLEKKTDISIFTKLLTPTPELVN